MTLQMLCNQLPTSKGMPLLLLFFSLLLLKDVTSQIEGFLVKTKNGISHLAIANPRDNIDFSDNDSNSDNGNGKYLLVIWVGFFGNKR